MKGLADACEAGSHENRKLTFRFSCSEPRCFTPGQRRYALSDAVEVIPLSALADAQDLFETNTPRMTNAQLVSKVWNYPHVLRDQGVSYGDYVEQITCLLFLKMDAEREELLGEASAIPPQWGWGQLANRDGDALELQYRHTLENLGRAPVPALGAVGVGAGSSQ